jgi:hypothetical protein
MINNNNLKKRRRRKKEEEERSEGTLEKPNTIIMYFI